MSEINYEQDVTIDEDSLDIEWLEQAKLTMKYCQHEAQTEREYQQAKENLDIIEADLYQKLCNDPDKYDLPKTTESAIAGAIKMQPEYKEAEEAVNQAKYEYNMAKAAVRAIYAKKDALENLVRLHGQQYFAGPSSPRDLTKEWQKKRRKEESNKSVKISNRKKKTKRRRRRKK